MRPAAAAAAELAILLEEGEEEEEDLIRKQNWLAMYVRPYVRKQPAWKVWKS